MKTIENVTIHKCSHCKKVYLRKYFCEKHEPLCRKNPDNISDCYACLHLDKVKVKLLTEVQVIGENYGVGYDEEMRSYNLLKCNKKEKYMIPIISAKKGNSIRNLLEDEDFEVMENKCELRKDYI